MSSLNPISSAFYNNTFYVLSGIALVIFLAVIIMLRKKSRQAKLIAILIAIPVYAVYIFGLGTLADKVDIPYLTEDYRQNIAQKNDMLELEKFTYQLYQLPDIKNLFTDVTKVSPSYTGEHQPAYIQRYMKGRITEDNNIPSSSATILEFTQYQVKDDLLAQDICFSNELTKTGFACSVVGTNQTGGDIIKDDNSNTFATDFNGTRLVVSVKNNFKLSDDAVIKVLQNIQPIDRSTIHFSRYEYQ